jgi:hypothetical protein
MSDLSWVFIMFQDFPLRKFMEGYYLMHKSVNMNLRGVEAIYLCDVYFRAILLQQKTHALHTTVRWQASCE